MFKNVEKLDGWLWPAHDKELICVADWVNDLNTALPHVEDRVTALQAGGSVGLWPDKLAQLFDTVYTMEPDPHSFQCLVHNCAMHENVVALNAALGNEHQLVSINREAYPTNVGAQYVDPVKPGTVPMLRIDDLALFTGPEGLDLLCLDIEGWEYQALLGAEETIKNCRPVIMVENKPLRQMSELKVSVNTVPHLMKKWGYEQVGSVHRDLIFKHKRPL